MTEVSDPAFGDVVQEDEVEPHQGGTAVESAGRTWRIERRLETPWYLEVGATSTALGLSVLLCAVLISFAGSDVTESFQALYNGAFGTRNAAIETLVQATPLIFTGLAATFAFRAKVWNIGGEGQLFAGAVGAYWASTLLADSLPRLPLIAVVMAFAAVFGAGWAGIAGGLRTKFGVNEIIATVMLNFVMVNIVSYLLSEKFLWQDPASFYAQTARMPDEVGLPRIFSDGRLHLGFIIGLVMAFVVWFVLERTSFGYEVRGIGVNPRVATYGGILSSRVIISTMLVSGAIAGMAGGSELIGIHLRLQSGISNEFGFTGIIIALVARLKPAGVVFAAIVAGALTNGATTMQLTTGVPAALVDVLKGLALVLVLLAAVVVNYRFRRVNADG